MSMKCWALSAMQFFVQDCAPRPQFHARPHMPVVPRVVPRTRAREHTLGSRSVAHAEVPKYRAERANSSEICEHVPHNIGRAGVVIVVYRDFHPQAQCFGVYHEGVLAEYKKVVLRGRVSTGMAPTGVGTNYETPLTPPNSVPLHVVWGKVDYFSKKWRADMPYALFYDEKEGLALHAGDTAKQRASHGCVRLDLSMAKALYEYYRERQRAQERVEVIVTTNWDTFARDWNSTGLVQAK